jgi:hypothetical protein
VVSLSRKRPCLLKKPRLPSWDVITRPNMLPIRMYGRCLRQHHGRRNALWERHRASNGICVLGPGIFVWAAAGIDRTCLTRLAAFVPEPIGLPGPRRGGW